ncbi:hypothetical protein DV735_g177, partial [Chaetothyriales sp. CBS 134920]
MDGLLIDSEDAYTAVTNTILAEHGRPALPWTVKAQLQGRPGLAATRIFSAWAQLPISQDAYLARQKELQAAEFTKVKPLPGVPALLRLHLALATSSHSANFELKTRHLQDLFSAFSAPLRIVGDDPRIPRGRGKPLPDIYLLALRCVNEQIRAGGGGSGEPEITPDECLVFEDSVPGVEAGRRAGMRVVWVPHPGLLDVFRGREEDVLAGLTGEHDEADLDLHSNDGQQPLPGSPGSVGKLRDGYGELLSSLEDFDYLKYGISVDGQH